MALQRLSLRLPLIIAVVQILSAFATDCNWQYFDHYQQKGCRPVLGDNGCPERFQCDELSEDELRTCVHKGKLYKPGDQIEDLSPCENCQCIVEDGSAFIECAAVDCPDWEPRNKSCYMGYKPTECCPTEMCPNGKDAYKKCSYKGKEYKIGDYIQTSEPCKSCICTEKWTGENGPGCTIVNCLTGIYAQKIRSGCLSIYSENRCCIIGTNCGGIHGVLPVVKLPENKTNYCHYRGKYYKKGAEVYLDTDKHNCIVCECTTPPDFTCIKKSCKPKPRDDCKATYGHCCPKYKCP